MCTLIFGHAYVVRAMFWSRSLAAEGFPRGLPRRPVLAGEQHGASDASGLRRPTVLDADGRPATQAAEAFKWLLCATRSSSPDKRSSTSGLPHDDGTVGNQEREGPGEERTNHSTSQPYTYNIDHNIPNRTRSNARDQPTRSTVVEASSGPQPHQPDRTHRTSFHHLGQFSSPRPADKDPPLMSTPQRRSSNSKTPINYHDLVFFVDPHQHLITPRAARRTPQAIAPHAMASDVRCACRRQAQRTSDAMAWGHHQESGHASHGNSGINHIAPAGTK